MFTRRRHCHGHLGVRLHVVGRTWEGRKGKGSLICIVLYYELLISKAFRYSTCVNEESHSFTCRPNVYPQVEWAITCLYSPAAERHRTGWYSFPVPLKVGGWVDLGGLVKCWGGLPTWRLPPIPVLASVAGNSWWAFPKLQVQHSNHWTTNPPQE